MLPPLPGTMIYTVQNLQERVKTLEAELWKRDMQIAHLVEKLQELENKTDI